MVTMRRGVALVGATPLLSSRPSLIYLCLSGVCLAMLVRRHASNFLGFLAHRCWLDDMHQASPLLEARAVGGGACALPPVHPALPQRPFVFQMHDHVAFAADHRDGLVEDDGKRHEHETGKDIAGQGLA